MGDDALWQRFATPARSFSPVPLWWWSGERVEAERLRWQLERLAAGGVFNVVVMNLAPTSPLYGADADDPAFASDRWWELFDGVCSDAQRLGVSVWFYDQIGFSGANFQGQVVRAHPEHAGRWIERVAQDVDGAGELRCPGGGTPIAAAALPLGADGSPAGPPVTVALEGPVARLDAPGRHRLMLSYAVERGFDYFSPAACTRLFDMVHGEFERHAGRWLGAVVVGSFQDELPNLPTWSATFAREFEARAGYDPVPHLAALWEDYGVESERFRYDVQRLRGALAEEAFFKPLHEWHERRGLLCGVDQQYGGREGRPLAAQQLYGDYPRTHRWYGAPGSDHHGDAKIHSSLAHHYGRERVWIEAFHTSGWGGTLEETFDWLLPWIGAGANLYDPHATYYSTRAGWWEWAPPATDWRQPYWRHYEHFSCAVTRLCSVLTWGHHACDIGVLFPSATAQSGLRLDGVSTSAQRAEALYFDLIGRMTWWDQRPGALNELARDFDVLDDDSVAAGAATPEGLAIGDERFPVVLLPGCEVLESATARRLVEHVDAGGMLIAIGPAPARAAGADGDEAAIAALRERFASGAARTIATTGELAGALSGAPARVRAPVPTLVRRSGDTTVVFVPAAHPGASRISPPPDADGDHPWIGGVEYDFDRARYAAHADVVVSGVRGAPELWEPFSGRRRPLAARETDGGVEVRVGFEDGPCALLVWSGGDEPSRAAGELEPVSEHALDGPWEVEVVTTLEDDWGDLAAPGRPGATVVETWALAHQRDGDGGAREVHATFGPRASWTGPAAPAALPAPGTEPERWHDAVWSPSRGIHKDSIHAATIGPSGRVPEEFLDFGRVEVGQAVHVRAVVTAEAPFETHLAVGAGAAKAAWIDGRPVALAGGGHLGVGAVRLAAGTSVLDLRLTVIEEIEALRAHFSFVADVDGYRRPEWMRPAGEVPKSSVIAFAHRVTVPAAPRRAQVLVGANGPCRVLVDGIEVGRQGGFDPYEEHDRDRLQPYELAEHLPPGEHELRLELLALGRSRPAAIVDGLIETEAGTTAVMSDERWSAERDGGAVALDLRLSQGGFDPAYFQLWRRPHPLPEGAWLEPGRGVAGAGRPWTVRAGGAVVEQTLTLTVPPGAERMWIPLAPGCTAAIELAGAPLESTRGAAGEIVVELPAGSRAPAACRILVTPAPGLSGGALLEGPVSFAVAAGEMELVDWLQAGLTSHSGGVRYRRRIDPPDAGDGELWLDLGDVRGTAEVFLDGVSAGVRVTAPYRFDLTGRAGSELDVLVLNTLGPHLDAISPTPYVSPGQKRSGLFGPVRLQVLVRTEPRAAYDRIRP